MELHELKANVAHMDNNEDMFVKYFDNGKVFGNSFILFVESDQFGYEIIKQDKKYGEVEFDLFPLLNSAEEKLNIKIDGVEVLQTVSLEYNVDEEFGREKFVKVPKVRSYATMYDKYVSKVLLRYAFEYLGTENIQYHQANEGHFLEISNELGDRVIVGLRNFID